MNGEDAFSSLSPLHPPLFPRSLTQLRRPLSVRPVQYQRYNENVVRRDSAVVFIRFL